MQLSSRILTALAVLILAVAVVAVRAGSPGTVEAATGTIDVLNVGTCYATDTDVFAVGDCDDGDEEAGYSVAGRDTITETGTVYATYAHDPKTAPDSPRGVLENSNLIKISVKDSGRDLRTPVLLGAGDNEPCQVVDEAATAGEGCSATGPYYGEDDPDTDVDESGYLAVIRKDYTNTLVADPHDFRWWERGITTETAIAIDGTDDRVISGITINKNGVTEADGTPPPYKPMFTVDGDDSPINLYGMYDADGTGTDANPEFRKLNNFLGIDEDVGSGRVANETGEGEQEVAPWFSVQVALPDGASATVMYVVYMTSEREVLVGGSTRQDYASDSSNTRAQGKNEPAFTKAERKPEPSADSAALVVEARSDGREGSKHLQLMETSRFSGEYVGYLELTDENGNDKAADDSPQNWGLEVKDATGPAMGEAAVLGVESGPVEIVYKDTDGATKKLPIQIDTVPPMVQIDTPAHNSEGQDTSPEFSGAYSDSESGLRKSTFRLYLDHTNDVQENGIKGKAALDLRVDMDNGYGVITAPTGATDATVESQGDYKGYTADDPTYGVIRHDDVFGLENGDVKKIDGDNHDDGAATGTFGDSERIAFSPDADYNNTIDFQALVVDVAGNIGFSDSDDDGPRFINNYGEPKGSKRKTDRYNVLGWYARHVFFLDETDPKIFTEQSVTGFYGEDDDDKPQVNRKGILVAFDRAVDPDSIDENTFTVTLDPTGPGATGASANLMDIDAQGRLVYLLLDEELASDATPMVDIASGQWVSDPAGNRLTGGDQDPFEANDGISPVITVSLSGGSGSGEGDEGPAKLTRNSIIVTIGADEEINSTPSLVVVCSNIAYDSDDDDENDKELSDLVGSRSGALGNSSANFGSPESYDCGDDYTDVNLQQAQSYSRPGLEWEYQWVNFSGTKALKDGKLTVVAYARDRQQYKDATADDATRAIDAQPLAADTYNWGSATAEFRYDTMLDDPSPTPGEDETVTETRPFVLLTYSDKSTIAIDEFKIGGTVQEMQVLGENRFLYWPEELSVGTHAIAVTAEDAAGNSDAYEYSFKLAERTPFNLKLIAGWNAVSFPANPVDPMIENVFTEGVVDMVAAWDISDPTKPWSIASRMEGEWSTHSDFATLTKVSAKYGYWVHAQGFVTQKIALIGQINRLDSGVVPPDLVAIPTEPGWNFVGVIDQDGDQTEDNFGDMLMTGTDGVKAGDYLGKNGKAYTWDPIRSRFDVLEAGDYVEIGDGIWVYYGGGIAP